MLLKNLTCIDGENKIDVKIENGIISEIGEHLDGEGLDCEGKFIADGFIDMHCHLREPGQEHKETIETGIASAIAGGYSAICPMANTNPINDNVETLEFVKSKAKGYNLFPICALSKNFSKNEIVDYETLKEHGAIAFSNDGKPVKDLNFLKSALEKGIFVISHSEIPELLGSRESEYLAVQKELEVVRETGAKYHFAHISTKESVNLIRKAKKEGLPVTCETAPHYFSLFKNEGNKYNTFFKVNPPLKEEEDVVQIIEGLKDGTIDVIATDHAPHTLQEKKASYTLAPNGICGFETSIAVALTYLKDYLSLKEICEKFSKNPREILNLGNFGKIEKGNIANFVILDINNEWTVRGKEFKSKCKITPFEGKRLRGCVFATVVNGEYYEHFTQNKRQNCISA